MLCETCEQNVQATAVKIYQGRKVCPVCFQSLMLSDVPQTQRQVNIVQTQVVATTICPECNSEIHAMSRKCPRCGALVQRLDRGLNAISTTWKKFWFGWLVVFGGIMFVGGIGAFFRCISEGEGEGLASFVVGLLIGIPSYRYGIRRYREVSEPRDGVAK